MTPKQVESLHLFGVKAFLLWGAGYAWVNDWGMIEKGPKQGKMSVWARSCREAVNYLREEHGQ